MSALARWRGLSKDVGALFVADRQPPGPTG
jgi:hypothetical protein